MNAISRLDKERIESIKKKQLKNKKNPTKQASSRGKIY